MITGNRLVNWIYRGLEVFVKVAALNVLWMVFTVVGAGVLGIFPASAALLSVIRKWMMEGMDTSVPRTFIGSYKKEFVKVNVLGYAALLYGFVLFTNYQFMLGADGIVQLLIVIGLIILGTLFFLTVTFLFPAIVHFDLPVLKVVKVAFLYGMTHFYLAIMAGIGLTVTYHIVLFFPGIFMWFIPSLTGIILMPAAYMAFQKFSRETNADEAVKV
ncbi:DUF624 domain-containing protein [Bacillus sp. H-16]|uniref:YesL family protein n=1 Tax=Alteribacter salitolerans TaxID=2912333 RepID=UPI0019657A28|nr:DUF624 domain-containing protein [Alteribacter salitolerans]MBM7094845.1 DUF624 domain-containing protein [Alteribacter salitolerans]